MKNNFTRNCPNCKTEISYKDKYYRDKVEKNNTVCKSCSKIGEKNSFYGKKHTKTSINKRLKTLESSEEWKKSVDFKKSDEHRADLSRKMSGENNPAFNRGTLEKIWEEKYGKEEAAIRQKKWIDKISIKFSGKNNHMYGKPSPIGSGNGWSGWYKEWYFRSLRELSYMINEIDKKDLLWENGEQKKYKISYINWDGKRRNYFPDFVVDSKYMIECKPLNLQKSASVLCKKVAAEEFCKKNNLKYMLLEPEILSINEIKKLYINKQIKFIPRYEEKFLKKYF